MPIQILQNPEQKCLELGGGDRPQLHPNWDAREGPNVDKVVDFEKPLPSPDNEWEGIFSHFALEHISWPNVRKFLAEVFRILKPGGKAIIAIPNTEAQLRWIMDHPEGWDGKGAFESCSEVLFGSLDYPENSHKSFWSPTIAHEAFSNAGFSKVVTRPYGERETDMLIEATKPKSVEILAMPTRRFIGTDEGKIIEAASPEGPVSPVPTPQPVQEKPKVVEEKPMSVVKVKSPEKTISQKMADSPEFRKEVFGKNYFNGGQKFGGYALDKWGAFRDFPVHHLTAKHILARRPASVLEVGCGRGYILKRIQDAGVQATGLEISKHCNMTRCCQSICETDVCQFPWPAKETPFQDKLFDLSYSVATLEHIPEKHLPALIKELARVSKRGLHGIDFGHHDDGFDKSHCSLFPKEKWVELFSTHAPGWPVEIIDKEELERGQVTPDIIKGDGKLKLNVGSNISMFHHGWENIDAFDFKEFAEQNGYKFRQLDMTQDLPYSTGVVDLIFAHHFLEHLTYKDGLKFLRECRRVINPETGCIRIVVPNAALLMDMYSNIAHLDCTLKEFDEINDDCAASPTDASKLYELLMTGHMAIYDSETLVGIMKEAGFEAEEKEFRNGHPQIIRETVEFLPCLSLYVEGTPKIK